MRELMLVVAALIASAPAFAREGELDGNSYCRTVISDGMFGQPKGERQHCVSFKEGVATDSANTFFGNPPERAPYTVKGRIVSFGKSKFVIAKDESDLVAISGSVAEGTVLDLK